MHNSINGWEYISAIFQIMINSLDKNNLVEPRLIFRGVTSRYFSSSKSIPDFLEKHPNFVTLDKHKDSKQERDKKAYEAFYKRFCTYYKDDLKKRGITCLEILQELMKCDEYKYVPPEYIKSGAAIRMQKLKNRSHIDYINYIKYLIRDAKIRFPEYTENYSDIEILADIQHKGGASCLVDFSNNFLISLWFATQTNNDDHNFGYLFCYDINSEMIEKDNLSILSYCRSKSNIEDLLYATTKSTRYSEEKSHRFWIWKPSFLNERIARQDSVFIFGLDPFYIKEHGIIVIPIPADWKKDIQIALKSYFGITEESIFGDNNGFATSHDKSRPYERVISHYFNEQFSPSSKNKSLILNNLQNGMSCLFHDEYDLALKYFLSFESSIKHKIRNILEKQPRISSIDDSAQDIKMFLIDIELHFSKALCLRHLDNKYRAIEEYELTKKHCIVLMEKIDENINYWKTKHIPEKDINKIERLKKYALTKYQKTIKDLIDLLYDTKQYNKALNLVSSIEKVMPKLSKPLLETITNELNTLHELFKHKNSENEIDSNVIKSTLAGTIQPLCYILNYYFICILKSVRKQQIDTESLNNLCEKITSKEDMNFSTQCHFTQWDFSDIVSALESYKESNPDLYHDLISATAKVEEFMGFINGKLRIPPY